MSSRALRTTVLALLVSVGFAETASAYHCPRIGRWLSRDPAGEPGFMFVQGVAASAFLPREPYGAVYSTLTAGSYFLPRDVDEGQPYHFVYNSPSNGCDPLGDAAMGLAWIEMLEPPTTQPPGTQPGPPTTSPSNPCQTEQACCTCLLYAESGRKRDQGCYAALVCIMKNRQRLSGDRRWRGHFGGEEGFCRQAEVKVKDKPRFQGGVDNKRYQECCKCKDKLKNVLEERARETASASCKAGCAKDPTGGAQYWFAPGRTPQWMREQERKGNCSRVKVPGCTQEIWKCKNPPVS